jgi:hypothetical protein
MPQRIHKVVDLPTNYLPKAFFEALFPDYAYENRDEQDRLSAGVTFYGHPESYGGLLWVPDDPIASSEAGEEPVAQEVLAVQIYARELYCNYVLFDADSDGEAPLPTWEWEW